MGVGGKIAFLLNYDTDVAGPWAIFWNSPLSPTLVCKFLSAR